MSRWTQFKLAVAAVAVTVFFVGVKLDSEVVRWVGIGLAASAWLLRFKEKGARRRTPPA